MGADILPYAAQAGFVGGLLGAFVYLGTVLVSGTFGYSKYTEVATHLCSLIDLI